MHIITRKSHLHDPNIPERAGMHNVIGLHFVVSGLITQQLRRTDASTLLVTPVPAMHVPAQRGAHVGLYLSNSPATQRPSP